MQHRADQKRGRVSDCLPQITINASLAVLEKSLWDWTKENAMWHLYRGTVWHPYVQLQHSSLTMLWSTFSACRYTCLCFKPRNWGSRQLHSLSDACFMQTSLNEILSAQEVWWKSMLFFIFFMFFQYRYDPKLAWLKVPQAYLSGNQAMTSKNSSNTLTDVAWRCMWSKILKK